jgi:hypothetical protein
MSVVLIRKQQNRGAMEKSLNGAITKHPLAANPMIIAYIVFPVAVIVGAVLLAVFFKW